jgi:hypothetical protein
MQNFASIEAVAQIIQVAVAPVFLLAGIAGLLSVLSTRLGRITDRARVIEGRIPSARSEEQKDLLRAETTSLWSRILLINWAIRLCVGGALMICLVIMTLFIGDFLPFNLSMLIVALFLLAMVLVISGLLFLLREVGISIHHMREGMELVLGDSGPDSRP